jgi:hypothetical protein
MLNQIVNSCKLYPHPLIYPFANLSADRQAAANLYVDNMLLLKV